MQTSFQLFNFLTFSWHLVKSAHFLRYHQNPCDQNIYQKQRYEDNTKTQKQEKSNRIFQVKSSGVRNYFSTTDLNSANAYEYHTAHAHITADLKSQTNQHSKATSVFIRKKK